MLVLSVFHLCKMHYATVKRVVDETLVDIKNDKTYIPFCPVHNRKNTHKIIPTSLDMHQIVKLKQNSSFQTTADDYNAYIRAPVGLPLIGYTAIYQAIKCSNYTVVRKEELAV